MVTDTIMQSENWDTVRVKVGEEEFEEAPPGSTIMKVLHNAK